MCAVQILFAHQHIFLNLSLFILISTYIFVHIYKYKVKKALLTGLEDHKMKMKTVKGILTHNECSRQHYAIQGEPALIYI